MYLKRLNIAGFRSYLHPTDISLGPYTVVIGPNNSGKSNLLRALDLFFSCVRYGSSDSLVPRWELLDHIPVSARRRRSSKIRLALTFHFDKSLEADARFLKRATVHVPRLTDSLKLQVTVEKDQRPVFSCQPSSKNAQALGKLLKLLASSIQFEYIPTMRDRRSPRMWREGQLLGALVRTLTARRRGRKSKTRKAIEALHKSLGEDFRQVTRSLTADVRDVVQHVKSVDFSIPSNLLEYSFRFGQPDLVEVDDGSRTHLSQKGDGLQGLVLTGILRYIAEQRGATMVVWGFEEPEAHLHPEAIRRMRSTLLKLSLSQQVLLTTHNPYFVNRADLDHNLLVEKAVDAAGIVQGSDVRSSETYSQIQRALGWTGGEAVGASQVIVLVEGDSEEQLLPQMVRLLKEAGQQAVDLESIRIQSCRGASNIPKWAAFYARTLVPCLALVDNDKAGMDAQDEVLDSGDMGAQDVFAVPLKAGRRESDFEDYLPPQLLVDALRQQFRIDLKPTDIDHARRSAGAQRPGKWKEGAKRFISSRGKPWKRFDEKAFAQYIRPYIQAQHIPPFIKDLLKRAIELSKSTAQQET